MIAATVTTAASADSIFNLIEAVTSDQLSEFSTGRVSEVHIQWLSGTFHHVYKPGTVVVATDSGFEFADPTTAPNKGIMVIRGSTGMNVISLKDIYLGGGVGTARISAYVV
jgi:hypothetical protein